MKKFIRSISDLPIDKRAAPIEEALEKSAFIALNIGGDHSREAFQQIVERSNTRVHFRKTLKFVSNSFGVWCQKNPMQLVLLTTLFLRP